MTANEKSEKVSDDGIKLHIGGWETHPEWKILDALPGPNVDYVGNCNDLSFLPDNSCAEIYASHVLEHLAYNGEIQQTLQGFFRVLKPGGRLRVGVPDLETLCHLFVKPDLAIKDRFHIMRIIFGGRKNEFDVHYTGFNFDIMGGMLYEAGFRDIYRVNVFDLFRDTTALLFHDTLISLNVQALKPKE